MTDAAVVVSRPARRRLGWSFWVAGAWLGAVVTVAVTASWLPLPDPNRRNLDQRLARPLSDGAVLGADGLGRDILSRLAYGARVSLVIGVAAVTIGMTVGGTLGMTVGYLRGRVEAVSMWAVNVLLAFPGLVLLLGLVAFVGQSLAAITLVVGVLSVPIYARVARASAMNVAQRDYVSAARTLGASKLRILRREVLPNVALPVLAFGLVALGVVIVLEGSLAFLGLSVQAPTPTWGAMIGEGRQHFDTTIHVSLVPAMAMFLTVLAVNVLADTLRGSLDGTSP